MSKGGESRQVFREAFEKQLSQRTSNPSKPRRVMFTSLEYSSSEASSIELKDDIDSSSDQAPSRQLSPQARVIRKSLKTHEEDKLGGIEDYDKDLAEELQKKFSLASRCKIVSFQCRNFKTYAQNSRVFKLSGSTAILGPNGSGKSNLADAVCFALGLEGNQIRGEGGNLHLMNGIVLREVQKQIARLIFQKDSPLPEKFGRNELMEIEIKVPWDLQKQTKPIGFTRIEVEFNKTGNKWYSQESKSQRRGVPLERAFLTRQFELMISCAALDQARQKRKALDSNFELSYIEFVNRCIQVVERYKLEVNYQDEAIVDKEAYNNFLSEHMNIEAGMKSFVVMQHDLNPADFNCKKHSEIIERISGAATYQA